MTNNHNPQSNKTRRSRITLILILLMLVSTSSCMVGYILGQRAVPQNGGEIIDTIVVSPGDAEQMLVSVAGMVRYTDGTPAANTKVELHSTPRTTITNEKGYFFFHVTETGKHTLYVVDEKGKTIASCPVKLDADARHKTVKITGDAKTGYTVEIPLNLLLIELEVTLTQDADGKTQIIQLSGVTAVKTDGTILTPNGTVHPANKRTITTAGGNIVFDDGTILLADGRVLLNDHSIVEFDAMVTLKDGTQKRSDDVVWHDNGAAILPDGTVLTPNGHVITRGNDIIHPDGYVILEDGTTVETGKGTVTLPDGTVIDQKDNTITLPDGIVVDQKDNTVILPDGTEINQNDHTITLPDGIVIDQNDHTITLPDGTVINQNDNTITLPDGMVIDQNDNTITLPDGTVINQDDNTITLPDGTVIDQNDNTVTLPDDTVIDQNKGEITKPDGTVTTPADKPEPDPEEDTDNNKPDIDVPGDNDNTTDDDNDNNNGGNTGGVGGGGTGGGSGEGAVTVTSEGKIWTQNTTVNLFAGIDKIYPGAEGVYKFNVSNGLSNAVNFTMTVTENKEQKNPIPFKLKLTDSNNQQVDLQNVSLAANTSMEYTLHWQWPYESGGEDADARDTAIGTADNLEHKVIITIVAEEVV